MRHGTTCCTIRSVPAPSCGARTVWPASVTSSAAVPRSGAVDGRDPLWNPRFSAQGGILMSREVSGGGLEPAFAWCHEQALCTTVQVKGSMRRQLLPCSHGLTRGDVPMVGTGFRFGCGGIVPRTDREPDGARRSSFTSRQCEGATSSCVGQEADKHKQRPVRLWAGRWPLAADLAGLAQVDEARIT